MRTLVLVPDPTAAAALRPLLDALPGAERVVVAYGRETAAALGEPALVYPLRSGTRLPDCLSGPLCAAIGADAVVAPLGHVPPTEQPVVALDLVPAEPAGRPAAPLTAEALTDDVHRRQALVRAGWFDVTADASFFLSDRALSAEGVAFVLRRLAALTGTTATAESARLALPPAEPAAPSALARSPMPPAPPLLAAPRENPTVIRYQGRHAGRSVLLLAGESGLDAIAVGDLACGTIVAVPAALPWLRERMGIAHYVCADTLPSAPAARQALAENTAVFVIGPAVPPAQAAPYARDIQRLDDLRTSGLPTLGWSDDLALGYFAAAGDAGLALQWSAWLGPAEIVVAGIDPADPPTGWELFWQGAVELAAARGLDLRLLGAPAVESPVVRIAPAAVIERPAPAPAPAAPIAPAPIPAPAPAVSVWQHVGASAPPAAPSPVTEPAPAARIGASGARSVLEQIAALETIEWTTPLAPRSAAAASPAADRSGDAPGPSAAATTIPTRLPTGLSLNGRPR